MELYEKSYSDVEISMVGRHQAGKSENGAGNLEILRKSGAVNAWTAKPVWRAEAGQAARDGSK